MSHLHCQIVQVNILVDQGFPYTLQALYTVKLENAHTSSDFT